MKNRKIHLMMLCLNFYTSCSVTKTQQSRQSVHRTGRENPFSETDRTLPRYFRSNSGEKA